MTQETLDIALQWHEAGIACIPILAHSKSPALDSWRPYQLRLPRSTELEAWFAHSGYGIAVVTGWRDLVIVDFDDLWTYSTWIAGLGDDLLAVVLSTMRVTTARGIHVYLYTSEAHNAKLDGIDVKARGGYCLTAPTIHPSGARYVSIGGIGNIKTVKSIKTLLPQMPEPTPEVLPAPEPESEFDAAMRAHGDNDSRAYALGALTHSCERVLAATVGQRNHTLNRCAWGLRKFVSVLGAPEIENALTEAAHRAGLGRVETECTIRSALRTR